MEIIERSNFTYKGENYAISLINSMIQGNGGKQNSTHIILDKSCYIWKNQIPYFCSKGFINIIPEFLYKDINNNIKIILECYDIFKVNLNYQDRVTLERTLFNKICYSNCSYDTYIMLEQKGLIQNSIIFLEKYLLYYAKKSNEHDKIDHSLVLRILYQYNKYGGFLSIKETIIYLVNDDILLKILLSCDCKAISKQDKKLLAVNLIDNLSTNELREQKFLEWNAFFKLNGITLTESVFFYGHIIQENIVIQPNNNSALHIICTWNCIDLIKMLIKNGMDPYQKNSKNETPFMICIKNFEHYTLFEWKKLIIWILKNNNNNIDSTQISVLITQLYNIDIVERQYLFIKMLDTINNIENTNYPVSLVGLFKNFFDLYNPHDIPRYTEMFLKLKSKVQDPTIIIRNTVHYALKHNISKEIFDFLYNHAEFDYESSYITAFRTFFSHACVETDIETIKHIPVSDIKKSWLWNDNDDMATLLHHICLKKKEEEIVEIYSYFTSIGLNKKVPDKGNKDLLYELVDKILNREPMKWLDINMYIKSMSYIIKDLLNFDSTRTKIRNNNGETILHFVFSQYIEKKHNWLLKLIVNSENINIKSRNDSTVADVVLGNIKFSGVKKLEIMQKLQKKGAIFSIQNLATFLKYEFEKY